MGFMTKHSHTFFRMVFLFQTKTEQIPVETETNITANVSNPATGGTIEVFNGTESMFIKFITILFYYWPWN